MSRPALVPYYCTHCQKIIVYSVPKAKVWCRCGRKAQQGEGKAKETA